MANYIRLPNGSYYEAKEGQSPSDAFRDAYKFYPEAFGETESKPKQDTTGFKAAASAGATSFILNQAPVATLNTTIVLMQYPEILVKINFGQHQYYAGTSIA